MNPQVIDIKEDKGLLTFTITGLNVSLINGTRGVVSVLLKHNQLQRKANIK